jgi:hypothetical protein
MVDLIIYVVATIGLTHILIDGSIFEPLRNLVRKFAPQKISQLISCYQCLGCWVGFLTGYYLLGGDWVHTLAGGFAGSFLSNWAAIYLNYLEASTIVNMGEQH